MKLTANKVKGIVWVDKGNGSASAQRHPDGANGLFLQVSRNDRKCWVQVLTQDGRRRNIGLGPCRDAARRRPGLTLADAREKAYENRNRLWRGEPIASPRRPAPSPDATTFEVAFRKVVAQHRDSWKRPEVMEQDWIGSMENHMGAVRTMDVAAVRAEHVVKVLDPHSHSLALKLKVRMGRAFAWAVAMGLRPDNPAHAADAVLPKDKKTTRHLDAVHWTNAPEVIAAVRSDAVAWENVGLALEFAALTAARSRMVMEAVWDEIDLDGRVWTLAPERMKVRTSEPYRCPLSARAAALLRSARGGRGPGDLVFPAASGKQMDRGAPGHLLKRVMAGLFEDAFAERCPNPDEARKAVPHGFRTTFRKWSSERMGSRWNSAAEAQLAHVEGKVARTYNRTDYLDERRELMDAWGAYLDGGESAE